MEFERFAIDVEVGDVGGDELDEGVVNSAPTASDLTDALTGFGELTGGGLAGCAGPGDYDEGHEHTLPSPPGLR